MLERGMQILRLNFKNELNLMFIQFCTGIRFQVGKKQDAQKIRSTSSVSLYFD